MSQSTGFPLSDDRLEQIANKACEAALAGVTEYKHALTKEWNNGIIGKMIESLVAATSGDEATPYKFAVKSTIIENTGGGGGGGGGGASKRGMNSAVGAYWNSAKDGMWTYKYDTGDKMGFEVVITVIWIALDVVHT